MFVGELNREALGLIPWVVSSWLLALIAALLLWFGRRWSGPARSVLRFLAGSGWFIAPGEVLIALYALGVPYAAIVTGFVEPEPLGLSGFSWWQTVGWGALLAGGLVPLAWVVWRSYLRVGVPPAGLLARSRQMVLLPAGRFLFLVWAAAEEFHWAFYRALPMLLWGFEAGLWIGFVMAVAERYASPRTTARLRLPGGLEEETWWLAKALVMTAVFAVLRNLWLCVVLHALLDGLAAWFVQRRATALPDRPADLEGQIDTVPAHPAAATPAVLLAAGTTLALLVMFTWGAARPAGLPAPTATIMVRPTSPIVPTPTATATPFPTLPATPTPTATPLPTATATPTPQRTHTVQEGDTLNGIAQMYGVSVADLMQLNGITDPGKLQVGQVLMIP